MVVTMMMLMLLASLHLTPGPVNDVGLTHESSATMSMSDPGHVCSCDSQI